MNLFQSTLHLKNGKRPPVWFMRQAGRYHSHYQEMRRRYSFVELCKNPEAACEATLGPIQDFDFDAAILFSDLLFPLEAMGMKLSYEPAPTLGWHLREKSDLKKLRGGKELARELEFQAEAMTLIRKRLPEEKGLLGFVGGPLTLFCYAVEGSHAGGLKSSRQGIHDGRYTGFVDKITDLLAANMALQARAGADAIAVLDTCSGEFDSEFYREFLAPTLKHLFDEYASLNTGVPAFYYSKGTSFDHWSSLEDCKIAGIGMDWRTDLSKTLEKYGKKWIIQGNIDPEWLFMKPEELETKLRKVFMKIKALPLELRKGWVCSLGHGVLQTTPEASVKLFIRLQREVFGEGR